MTFREKFGINFDTEDDDFFQLCDTPSDLNEITNAKSNKKSIDISNSSKTLDTKKKVEKLNVFDRFRYKEKSPSENDTNIDVKGITFESDSLKTVVNSVKNIIEFNDDKSISIQESDSQNKKKIDAKPMLPKEFDIFFEDDFEEEDLLNCEVDQKNDNSHSVNNISLCNKSPSNLPTKHLPTTVFCSTKESSDLLRSKECNSLDFVNDKKNRKRKFPGPAGLLPVSPMVADMSKSRATTVMSPLGKCLYEMDSQNSQTDMEDFQKTPWQSMLKDLESKNNLRQMYYWDIKTMLQKASRKLPPKHVVAQLLCVLLDKLSYNNWKGEGMEGATAVFKDETGVISGSISSVLIEEYKEHLVPGAVLFLKEVSMLFDQIVVRSDNLVSLYDLDGKLISVNKLEFTAESKNTNILPNESNRNICEDENMFEDEFNEFFQDIDESQF